MYLCIFRVKKTFSVYGVISLYPQAGFLGNKNYKIVVLPLFAFRTLQVFLVQRGHSS